MHRTLTAWRGEAVRVRGTVQGVGFRPTVWRLAQECGIRGAVWNDAQGVLIHAWGTAAALEDFVARLRTAPPPLARIVDIERSPLAETAVPTGFVIAESRGEAAVHTNVAPDAATCPACLGEITDPADRRYRYPFTNCTHCGPRLSIVRAIPYDRANTSMAEFPLCAACEGEYNDPADRRFHAQPNACPACGPQVWLEDETGAQVDADDAIAAARTLIMDGAIVAVKGLGGVHLACDAGNPEAVTRLRQRKHRYHKPLALMARDVEMVREYAVVGEQEQHLLEDAAAPVVVLRAHGRPVAPDVAPGQASLGFMLPYTPLHHLLMADMPNPVVLTSGNRSDEPQCIANDDARRRLRGISDYWLLHNRDIVNRLDDSVMRVVAGRPRLLRRARGYAPAPIPLPPGFEKSPAVLAMGGELKNTFALLKEGAVILSRHLGDMEDAATQRDYRHAVGLYTRLFEHRPALVAVDLHPDYAATRLGEEIVADNGATLVGVQHHHAHIAACMAEHGLALDSPPVLGITLDGLGFGDDSTLWGGEFLLADYTGFRRLACFQPVPLLGGATAMREPWRNTFAHLEWEDTRARYPHLDIVRFLANKPLTALAAMQARGINSPPASSCGRLIDAVAAAVGVCRESISFEGQAAIALETLAEGAFDEERLNPYPHELREQGESTILGWHPLWQALLRDLEANVPVATIAARFHHCLIQAVADTAQHLAAVHGLHTVVLGGGVFQNRLLLEGVNDVLGRDGYTVLIPEQVPANDGGLSLGQAAVAAARALTSTGSA